MSNEITILRIYTDGACSGNQNDENIGGWGSILEFGPHQKEMFGGEISWLKNGWMTSGKKPVENREIWEELLPFLEEHDFTFYRVKGHVNVDWHMAQGESANPNIGTPFLQKEYSRFREWNGDRFSFNDFLYITRMNNRADKLANKGMDQYR